MSIKKFLFFLGISCLLVSCSNEMKSKIGLSKSEPDEFTVVQNDSLIVPPVLNLPDPGKAVQKKSKQKGERKDEDHEDRQVREKFGI